LVQLELKLPVETALVVLDPFSFTAIALAEIGLPAW
jgi:hypothetical protein